MRPDGRWGRLLCRADDFDLVLVVEMENTDVIVPNRECYDDFLRFYGQANIDPGERDGSGSNYSESSWRSSGVMIPI